MPNSAPAPAASSADSYPLKKNKFVGLWKLPSNIALVAPNSSIPNWATSWENLLMTYANNKGADQPAHPRSLISAFVFAA